MFKSATHILLFIAGLAQITLALGSLAIPKVLQWKHELAKTSVLIKQMFWTYAGYIFVINISFGLLSVFDFEELTNDTKLSTIITGFITLYWLSRVLIQFFYFDRSTFPGGFWSRMAEVVLTALFIALSVVYIITFLLNLSIIKS